MLDYRREDLIVVNVRILSCFQEEMMVQENLIELEKMMA